jgi:hypothetical protein
MDKKAKHVATAAVIPVGIAIYDAYVAAAPDARNTGLLVGFGAYLLAVMAGWICDRVRRRRMPGRRVRVRRVAARRG